MSVSGLVKIIFFIILIMGVYLLFTDQVAGRTKMILIIFILVLGIYLFMKLPIFRSYNDIQYSPVSAKDGPYTIDGSSLKKTDGHYSLSMWVYIDDWNHNYGTEKVILQSSSDGTTYNPKISLDAYKNDVTFDVEYYDANGGTTASESITVNNVNLQKWVHLAMCINDRTIDIYLNGKLVKSKGLENVIKATIADEGVTTEIVPNSGFGGFISNFRYYNKFLTPQQVWNIYREGYGDMLSSFLDKYGIKLSFYEDNVMKREYNIL